MGNEQPSIIPGCINGARYSMAHLVGMSSQPEYMPVPLPHIDGRDVLCASESL